MGNNKSSERRSNSFAGLTTNDMQNFLDQNKKFKTTDLNNLIQKRHNHSLPVTQTELKSTLSENFNNNEFNF